ncbi:dihydropteroate synthase [Salipiger mucosus]|uniref:Dihydropteroate synthase n=1 Tax=Salipiger mucosus DSM 16094 TaxID=1123237 RepID=S9QGU1_9RHOB|nr:dihydropteroate synthase [Salipiger mucosus]EPX78838.1 Dihydropteroate synthase [Salipiger mucosus DSM 16094]
MRDYYRPLPRHEYPDPSGALPLAGGPLWFTECALHRRDGSVSRVPARDVPPGLLARLTAPRAPLAGVAMDRARLMGILNVTPDSFSDGGLDGSVTEAAARARALAEAGAEILDVGGESTRPGSLEVPAEDEIARTAPVIEALDGTTPVSIDTRKASVARAAVTAGAALVNDVSGLTFDPALADYVIEAGLPVCIMHAQGDPQTMQDAPRYDDVLLDVYDWLEERVEALVARGHPRELIVVDPGIGFGKTQDHNLALLRGLSIFHGLGCPVLLGASRKGFIGRIGNEPEASRRAPGSIAVALAGAAQGVQILRVHDVAETRRALALWEAVTRGPAGDKDEDQG